MTPKVMTKVPRGDERPRQRQKINIRNIKTRLEGKHETDHEEQHKCDRASNRQKLTKEVIGNRQTNDYMILIIGMFFQVKYTTDKGRRNLETRHYNRDVLTAMDNDINNLSEDKRRPTYG